MDQLQGVFEALAKPGEDVQDLRAEMREKSKRGTGSEVQTVAIPVGSGVGFGYSNGTGTGFTDDEYDSDIPPDAGAPLTAMHTDAERPDSDEERFLNQYGIGASDDTDDLDDEKATEIANRMMSKLQEKQVETPTRNPGNSHKKPKRTRAEISAAKKEREEREAFEKEQKRLKREADKVAKLAAKNTAEPGRARTSLTRVKEDPEAPDHRPDAPNEGLVGKLWNKLGNLGIGDGGDAPASTTTNKKAIVTIAKKKPAPTNEAKNKAVLLHKVRGYVKLVRKYRNDAFDPGDASSGEMCNERSTVHQLEQALEALQFEMNRIDPRPWAENAMMKGAEFVERLSYRRPFNKMADLRGFTSLMAREIENKNFDEELDELAVMYSDRCVMTLPVRFGIKVVMMAGSMHGANQSVDIAMQRYPSSNQPGSNE